MKTDNELKREPGFYWVKYEGEWRIAFWDGRVEWSVHVVGDDLHYTYNSDLEAIH